MSKVTRWRGLPVVLELVPTDTGPARVGWRFREYCDRCALPALWEQARFFQICTACGDRFPCASRCSHVDCRRYREALRAAGADRSLANIGSAPVWLSTGVRLGLLERAPVDDALALRIANPTPRTRAVVQWGRFAMPLDVATIVERERVDPSDHRSVVTSPVLRDR